MNPASRFALTAAILLAVPVITGCQHAGNVRTLSQADNGGTITLSRHDQLQVELPGNPTTGHSWQTVKMNSWVLAPLGRPSFQPETGGTNGSTRVGAGGIFLLTYEAVGTGTSPLELSYSRPWEPETSPAEMFKVTVTVSK